MINDPVLQHIDEFTDSLKTICIVEQNCIEQSVLSVSKTMANKFDELLTTHGQLDCTMLGHLSQRLCDVYIVLAEDTINNFNVIGYDTSTTLLSAIDEVSAILHDDTNKESFEYIQWYTQSKLLFCLVINTWLIAKYLAPNNNCKYGVVFWQMLIELNDFILKQPQCINDNNTIDVESIMSMTMVLLQSCFDNDNNRQQSTSEVL